jgi:hypothetical protein
MEKSKYKRPRNDLGLMQHIIWGVFVALYSKNTAEIKKPHPLAYFF